MRRSPLLLIALLSVPSGTALAAKLFTLSLEDVARGSAEVVDLTHELSDAMPLFPGGVPFSLTPLTKIPDGYAMNSFCMGEHTGTHLDAPGHFGKGLSTVSEIPAVRLISLGIQIDVRAKTSANPDYVLTLPDLLEWEKANGKVPARSLVILNTGWSLRWANPDRFLNKDEAGAMHFPGFGADAVAHLLKERDVNALGTDAASIDPGTSITYEGHKALLLGGRYQVENLANLDILPVKGFTVIVAPLKISRGSGAPARVFAIVPR